MHNFKTQLAMNAVLAFSPYRLLRSGGVYGQTFNISCECTCLMLIWVCSLAITLEFSVLLALKTKNAASKAHRERRSE